MAVDTNIYGSGDTCLLINPYDSYHMFTLYDNWLSDNPTPINLANGVSQKFYLVFKSNKKEVRISEFELNSSKLTVDKTNGEVIFKISKDKANVILGMTSREFYVTRVFENTDNDDTFSYNSTEEVVFSGYWAKANDWSASDMSSTLISYKEQLDEKNNTIDKLTNDVLDKNKYLAEILSQNEDLNSQILNLQAQIASLEAQLAEYANSKDYNGTVIDNNAQTFIVQGASDMTADQLKEALESYNSTSKYN